MATSPRVEPDREATDASDAGSAQRRLRGLRRANGLVIGDLTLPVVLQRIVEAACDLVQASYGTLGVLDPGGGLSRATPRIHRPGRHRGADAVVEDVLAVVREGLTNVARHAGASQVAVKLGYAGGELALELADNGSGMQDAQRRSGPANLRERAERRGGTLVLSNPSDDINHPHADSDGGTTLQWTIPLR